MKKLQRNNLSSPAIHGVGRRKSAVARVWLKKRGSGNIAINGLDYGKYFDTQITRTMVDAPLRVVTEEKSFDIKVNVEGGGKVSQAEASRLGIARALLSLNESFRQIFRKNNFLTVDDRIKERKKYGQRGARRKFQFVKR
jgi:small subunit ribosomal protein S9